MKRIVLISLFMCSLSWADTGGVFIQPKPVIGAATPVSNTLSFIGTATTAGATGSNVSIAVPTGCTTNDLLVLACAERLISDGITQSSFTVQRFGAQNNTASTRIATHVVAGGDGSGYTLTNTANIECAMGCFRSSSGSAPTIGNLGTASPGSGSSMTFSAVTTGVDKAWYVGVSGMNLSAGPMLSTLSSGSPTPTTRADTANGGGTTSKQTVALITAEIAAAGSSGNFVYNLTASNTTATDAIEIRP